MSNKKRNMISFYVPMDISQIPDLRRRLNDASGRAGFVSTHGPKAGQGSFAAAMLAIAEGKVRLVNETDQVKKT